MGEWSDAARIIGSEYAGEHLLDQVASPNEYDDLVALADLTSPAIRAAHGEIELVPLGDRLCGPGTGLIMSAFSWPGHGSRFSDGKFGVFHAGGSVDTAVAETTYHQARFLARMPAQAFGAAVRQQQAFGIVYDGVRDTPHGACVAIFRPPALSPPVRVNQTLEYHWDGHVITVR